MNIRSPSFPKFTVRVKILIMFLALALISLLITGYVALFTIGDVAKSAESSSLNLGQQALDTSTASLLDSAEKNLVQVASDQAVITEVLFEDTETELQIMAVQAETLQRNPPVKSIIPSYGRDNPPEDPFAAVLYSLPPGVTISPYSEEFKRTAGMDDLLKGMYDADTNLTSVYLATDSGILRIYPWETLTPSTIDPRQRAWFTGAKTTEGVYWSEPYVDAARHGLVVTAAMEVPTSTGSWVIGSDVSVDTISSAFLNKTLGGNGYAILLDSQGNVVSRPGMSSGNISWDQPFPQENAFKESDPAIIALAHNMTAGKTGIEKVRFGNRESFVAYAPVRSLNWSLAVSLPVDEVTAPLRGTQAKIVASTREAESSIATTTSRIMIIFTVLFCILLIIVIALAWYLSRIITQPVDSLKRAAIAIGHGDLEYRVTLSTGDEFEDLAHSFNTMSADLRKSIDELQKTTAEKERYAKEMEIAKEIQDTILPESIPSIPGFEICATTLPAMEIGGDLYDFIPMTNGRWGFVIADVSGKGVSAALYMALCRTLIRLCGIAQERPDDAIREANRLIYEDGRSSMFITTFYGVLDPRKMSFTYVNAGHNPPLLFRGKPPFACMMPGKGIALGVIDEVRLTPETLLVERGDLIVLYTDGVTETFNGQENFFGEERLIASVSRNLNRPVHEIATGLINDISEFSGTEPQSDDITLILIRVT